MAGLIVPSSGGGAKFGFVGGNAFTTGRFYGMPCTATNNLTVTANRTYYYPFIIVNAVTAQSLSVNVVTGVASSNGRMGIYTDSAGRPNTLVATTATFTPTATAVYTATISGGYALAVGVYWFAYQGDSAITVTEDGGMVLVNYMTGFASAADANSATVRYTMFTADTYAAGLPSTAGAISFGTSACSPRILLGT